MRFLFALIFALQVCAPSLSYAVPGPQQGDYQVRVATMLNAVIVTGAGSGFRFPSLAKTFQASGTTSAGSGSATVLIEVSDVDSPGANDWITLGTIVLTLGTTNLGEGFATSVKWKWFRARVSAISGTNATVSVVAGY